MSHSAVQQLIDNIYNKTKKNKDGKVASYIPQLAQVNPNLFGICFVDCNNNKFYAGEAQKDVAIESISKLFTFSNAVKTFGYKTVLDKIGVHGSSLPFNSVIAADLSPSHTINGFVNQGAMATTSLFYQPNKEAFKSKILKNLDLFANKKLRLGKAVYHSESDTNSKNMSLAYLLKSFKRFYGEVNSSVDVYTAQCSKMVSAKDLATMACVFAKGGIHPETGERLLTEDETKFIIRALQPEGLYEYSDEWATQTGCIAAKSGVGGGILIIIPGIGGLGLVSPPLDKIGNSVRGISAGKDIVIGLKKMFNKNDNIFHCKINHSSTQKTFKPKNNTTKKI